jgi:hypothetical protein
MVKNACYRDLIKFTLCSSRLPAIQRPATSPSRRNFCLGAALRLERGSPFSISMLGNVIPL